MSRSCEECGGNQVECRCKRVKEIQELIRLKREEFSAKIRDQLEEKLRDLASVAKTDKDQSVDLEKDPAD